MLDKFNSRLLKLLNKECGGVGYKVLEIKMVLDAMVKYKLDVETLNSNLKFLQERGFIDIKYSDEEELCLAVLPKGRVHSEEEMQRIRTENRYFKLAVLSSIGSVVFALIGGFLAMLILK